jgi:hypothetical protein
VLLRGLSLVDPSADLLTPPLSVSLCRPCHGRSFRGHALSKLHLKSSLSLSLSRPTFPPSPSPSETISGDEGRTRGGTPTSHLILWLLLLELVRRERRNILLWWLLVIIILLWSYSKTPSSPIPSCRPCPCPTPEHGEWLWSPSLWPMRYKQ